MDVRSVRQRLSNQAIDVRIQMHGVNEFELREGVAER